MSKRPAVAVPTQRNVRNKKTRNPGYKAGDHWVECARCGSAILSSDSKITWDNLVVCPDDYEPRHEQDFVRSKQESQTPSGNGSSESSDSFVTNDSLLAPTTSVPAGTFNPNTL